MTKFLRSKKTAAPWIVTRFYCAVNPFWIPFHRYAVFLHPFIFQLLNLQPSGFIHYVGAGHDRALAARQRRVHRHASRPHHDLHQDARPLAVDLGRSEATQGVQSGRAGVLRLLRHHRTRRRPSRDVHKPRSFDPDSDRVHRRYDGKNRPREGRGLARSH